MTLLDHDNENLRLARRAVAEVVARYQWDGSKHPRGQPENAGEFAKVSGGGSAAVKPSAKPLHVITGDIHEMMAQQETKEDARTIQQSESARKPKSLWDTMAKAEPKPEPDKTPKSLWDVMQKAPVNAKTSESETTDTKSETTAPPAAPPTNSAGVPMVAPRRLKDGRPVGPAIVDISQLHIDPERFQYKVSGINSKTGTDASLKSVDRYDPTLGGSMLVWEDPEDGQTYVVNGHHRHEIANRSGHWEGEVGTADEGSGWSGEMQVFYVNAQSAKVARSHGALANIAEGHGSEIDAAKYLRDSGETLESLKKHHIAVSGKVAHVALSLAKLSDTMFQRLSNGRMTVGRASAIADHLPSHDAQEQLYGFITKREANGKTTFSDGKVAEMARATATQPKTVVTDSDGGMFKDWFEEQAIEQRADVSDHVRRNLAGTFRTFKEASSDRRKGLLESTGANVIDTEGNQQRAHLAELAVDDFDHRANAAGDPVALILNLYAEKIKNAPRKRNGLVEEALGAVRKQFDIERQPVSADAAGGGRIDDGVQADDPRRSDPEHPIHDRRADGVDRQSSAAIQGIAERYAGKTGSMGPATPEEEAESFSPYTIGTETHKAFVEHYVHAVKLRLGGGFMMSQYARPAATSVSPLAEALERACRLALAQCG